MQASSTWSWGCRCLCGDRHPGSSVPASLLGLSPAIYAQLPCGAQVCFLIPTPTCYSLRKPNQRQTKDRGKDHLPICPSSQLEKEELKT